MTHSSSPLTSLPLTHFPRWLSSLPVPQLILPSPETSSSNYPHTSLETASEESASNPYGLGQTRAGTMGLASPVRMAHAPKHQDLWGGRGSLSHPPWLSFSPGQRPRLLLSLFLARGGHQSYLSKRTARREEKEIKGTLR